jgi:hypothetical protein
MRCPVCRAEANEGSQCRRCRADLSLLVALQKQRRHAVTAAYRCLRQGRYQHALTLAEGAEALRSDEDTWQLRVLIYLLKRDFASAWRVFSERIERGGTPIERRSAVPICVNPPNPRGSAF